jgi:hypothetical protein
MGSGDMDWSEPDWRFGLEDGGGADFMLNTVQAVLPSTFD